MPFPLEILRYRHNRREGLHLIWGGAKAEVAPLPNWSLESLDEAILHLQNGTFSPAVSFGLESLLLQRKFPNVNLEVGLCALNKMKEGCRALKLKIGHLESDEAITLIQKFVGRIPLRLDINRKYDLEKAKTVLGVFPEGTFAFVEEPLSDPAQIPELRKFCPHPFALDESLRDRPLDFCLKLAEHFIIKPTLQGGIGLCCFIRDEGKKHGIISHLSSSFESPVGLRAIKHMAVCCNFPTEAMGLDAVSYEF
ncbi:MAG: hypothetical protein ChlgKO_14370 [Chlamydiales bacterium]